MSLRHFPPSRRRDWNTGGGTTSCHLGWIKHRGWICVDLFPSSRHDRGERGESRKRPQNLDDTAHDEGMVPRGVFHVCRRGKDNLGTFLSTSLKTCWSTSSAGSRCCEDHQWTKGERNQFYLYKSSLHTKVKHLGVPPSCRCRHVQYFNAWVSKTDRCKRNAKEKPCVEAGLQIHWLPSLARRGGSGCD